MHRGNHLFLMSIWLKSLATPRLALGVRAPNSLPRKAHYVCATQVAIRAREENPSFFRILPMWFSTVRSEIESF
jgi:hypothetical protein